MLDDDDMLTEDALATMAAAISGWPDAIRHSALLFVHGNGSLAVEFALFRPEDFQGGRHSGDLLPVLQRSLFLASGYRYPATPLGAEHLLFWKIAMQEGVPVWNKRVGIVGDDAPTRLTCVQSQIHWAEEHARIQETTIAEFGTYLESKCPSFLRSRHLAAATYWLLAGERRRAATHLTFLVHDGSPLTARALEAFGFLPGMLRRLIFGRFRHFRAAFAQSPKTGAPGPRKE
jgi:GalNAc5-diNAcBac-PP-undecaprenol beta-1,3-glucosyltransferase